MNAKFLIGKYVYLRPLEKEDIDMGYYHWINDPDICKFNTHHRFPVTKENLVEFIESLNNTQDKMVFAVTSNKTQQYVGNASIQNINYINRCAEIASIIGIKGHDGLAYTLESYELLIDHAFNNLNLNRIYGGTISPHIVGQKIMELLNFQKEGVRRQAMYKHNQYYDLIEYGLLKEEWIEFRNKK